MKSPSQLLRSFVRVTLHEDVHDSNLKSQIKSQFNAKFPEDSIQRASGMYDFSHYKARREDKPRTQAEREIKRIWSQHADHDFFDKELRKVHVVEAYGMAGGYGGSQVQRFEAFLKGINSKSNMNELSTTGLLPGEGFTGYDLGDIGIRVEGHVTFAGSGDLLTQWLSDANEEDIAHHISSGLPKRPYVENLNNVLYMMVLNRKDWLKDRKKAGEGEYFEVIIDNWRPVAICLTEGFIETKKREIPAFKKLCADRRLLLEDEFGKPVA